MRGASAAIASLEWHAARGKTPAIFLDFDGTLAPLVAHPSDARLSAHTRGILRALLRAFPVAIVSGRDLSDVEKRVGIPGIAFAGSHGLEWKVGSRARSVRTGAREKRVLREARETLLELANRTPRLIIENKKFSFALNYRALGSAQARKFQRAARAVIAPELSRLRILDDDRTFEILPATRWSKGHCAEELLKEFSRHSKARYIPVYLGDSETDEDAFRSLARGITIRIGKKAKSAAQYSIPRSGVDSFLTKIAQIGTANEPKPTKPKRRPSNR